MLMDFGALVGSFVDRTEEYEWRSIRKAKGW